jgi:hypothetical protein
MWCPIRSVLVRVSSSSTSYEQRLWEKGEESEEKSVKTRIKDNIDKSI